jgi:hypothetical protein
MNDTNDNQDNTKLDRLYYDTRYQKKHYTKNNTKTRLSIESRYTRYKEVIKQTTRDYYQKNKEKCIAENRLYYLKHKEAIEARKKQWRLNRIAKKKYQNLLIIFLYLDIIQSQL